MTTLLEEAFSKVQGLPKEEQDIIATLILEEIAEERRWDESFSRSQGTLGTLAAKAREERETGRVKEGGFDSI